MENALAIKDEGKIVEFGVEQKEGTVAASLLRESMSRKSKKILFNGKEYAEFHDLQVVCNYFGHSVRTYDAHPVDINGVKGFKARADLISKDGIHIGGAEAYCLQDEPNWARKPLFQLASMAQTRAAAKCITNDYRWVLDLAGYGTTPAEEITSDAEAIRPKPLSNYTPEPSSEVLSTTLLVSELKDFVSKKGTVFYRIYAPDMSQYMIFDKQLKEMVKDLVGKEVAITYEKSKYGNTVKSMAEL